MEHQWWEGLSRRWGCPHSLSLAFLKKKPLSMKKKKKKKKEEGKLGLFSLRNFFDFGEEGNSWFVEKQS
jgi:hypothetical protein